MRVSLFEMFRILLGNIFQLIQIVFAQLSGVYFDLEIFELIEYLVILDVSFGEQHILLLINHFVHFYFFLFLFSRVNMNRNVSKHTFKLFSSVGFGTILGLIIFIFWTDNVEVTFNFSRVHLDLILFFLMASLGKTLLYFLDVLPLVLIDFIYFYLHGLSFLFLELFCFFHFLSLSLKIFFLKFYVQRLTVFADMFPKLVKKYMLWERILYLESYLTISYRFFLRYCIYLSPN